VVVAVIELALSFAVLSSGCLKCNLKKLFNVIPRKKSMNATISILAEIPEDLHETLKGYLESHPDWDQDRVFSAALSLFLIQNGECDRRAARVYLNTLFQQS